MGEGVLAHAGWQGLPLPSHVLSLIGGMKLESPVLLDTTGCLQTGPFKTDSATIQRLQMR